MICRRVNEQVNVLYGQTHIAFNTAAVLAIAGMCLATTYTPCGDKRSHMVPASTCKMREYSVNAIDSMTLTLIDVIMCHKRLQCLPPELL